MGSVLSGRAKRSLWCVPPYAIGDLEALLGLGVRGQLGQGIGEPAWYGSYIGALNDGNGGEPRPSTVVKILYGKEVCDVLFFYDALYGVGGGQRAAGGDIGHHCRGARVETQLIHSAIDGIDIDRGGGGGARYP